MSAYKKLNQQDAFITTYTARKRWTVGGEQYKEHGIQNIVGLSGSLPHFDNPADNVYGGGVNSPITSSFNRKLVFASNRHLYYSSFSSSIIPHSSSFENYLQSSFNISGSRYINDRVAILSLPKEVYGTHIEPGTIEIIPDLLPGEQSNYITNNYVTDAELDPEGASFIQADNLYTENTFNLYNSTFPLTDLDYIEEESDYVIETKPIPGEYLDISVPDQFISKIKDDGEGNLYLENSNPRRYVGNVIYPHGQIIITDDVVAMYYNYYFNGIITWKSNLPIFTHNYHCKVKTSDFNFTQNRTSYNKSTGEIAPNLTGPAFTPYFTTVGLYNDANELVAVAKMAQPIPKSNQTDMSIVVRLDMNFGVNRFEKIPT